MVPLKTHSQELGRSGTAFWVKVLWYLLYHYLETGNPIMPLNGLPVCELLQGFERIDEHFSSRPHSQSDGVLSPLGAQIRVLQMQPVLFRNVRASWQGTELQPYSKLCTAVIFVQ